MQKMDIKAADKCPKCGNAIGWHISEDECPAGDFGSWKEFVTACEAKRLENMVSSSESD